MNNEALAAALHRIRYPRETYRARALRPRLRHSAWLPFTRLDVNGRPVGLVWRESGVWYSAPWDDTGATEHTSRDAAVRCLLARHGLEGAVKC